MASNYSRWYREGTCGVVNGSTNITGVDTYWLSAGLHAGDIFSIDDVTIYEVDSVVDNTHITLRTAYTGSTQSGVKYSIIRQFDAAMSSEIAAKTAGLLGDFRRYIDTDMQSIHGKSAYELAKTHGYVGTEAEWLASLKGLSAYAVAKESGYTGTQAQWLESLKAAGEWTKLEALTEILSTGDPATIHNIIPRGKDLGTKITDEQLAAIRNGTYDDLYVGDYWTINTRVYRIVHISYPWGDLTSATDPATGQSRTPKFKERHIVLMPDLWLVEPPTLYYTMEQATDTGWPGYIGSNWYTTIRPQCLEIIEAAFGASNLVEWVERVPSGYNTSGVITGANKIIMKCELPTTYMLFGQQWRLLFGDSKWDNTQCLTQNGALWQFALYRHETYSGFTHLHTDLAIASGSFLRDVTASTTARNDQPLPDGWTKGLVVPQTSTTTLWIRRTENTTIGFRPIFCVG